MMLINLMLNHLMLKRYFFLKDNKQIMAAGDSEWLNIHAEDISVFYKDLVTGIEQSAENTSLNIKIMMKTMMTFNFSSMMEKS